MSLMLQIVMKKILCYQNKLNSKIKLQDKIELFYKILRLWTRWAYKLMKI